MRSPRRVLAALVVLLCGGLVLASSHGQQGASLPATHASAGRSVARNERDERDGRDITVGTAAPSPASREHLQHFASKAQQVQEHGEALFALLESQARAMYDEFNSKLLELQRHRKQNLQPSDEAVSFLETKDVPSLPYAPESTPWDNPNTDLLPTPIIPHSPECTIRPQTVLEIYKMRRDAADIGHAIEEETKIMAIRKGYIERFSLYINDRIRELNKVKDDLRTEIKWVKVSSERIHELSEREKLIKLEDVMQCLARDTSSLSVERDNKDKAVKSLQEKQTSIQGVIKSIRDRIANLNLGKEGGAAANTQPS